MPDHKFEPGQLVMVRDHVNKWILKHFSHLNSYGGYEYATTDGNTWQMCLPFNESTKHLQNTTQPYEPPKPPQEYEWGQKVRVLRDGIVIDGLYVGKAKNGEHYILLATRTLASVHGETTIRPLPDDTAAHADD